MNERADRKYQRSRENLSASEQFPPQNRAVNSALHSEKADRSPPHPQVTRDIKLYRSLRNDLPLVIASLAIAALLTLFTMPNQRLLGRMVDAQPLAILAGVLAVGFGVVCTIMLLRRFNFRYLIANDGIKALRGIISNNQVDAKLEYYQIRGTEIHRSLFQRLVGTGDLLVRGSTSNDTEVAFKGIYDPYRYQKIIQDRHRVEAGATPDRTEKNNIRPDGGTS
ncbi:MAG: PH domain-containing protein [Deltaproteobacteria bacterium]|nr:PH domain-containing protein [Deltaproteobacteria bacterium]